MQSVIFITGIVSLGALLTWMFWAASRILKEDNNQQRGGGAPWVHPVTIIRGAPALRFRDIRAREAERMAAVPGMGIICTKRDIPSGARRSGQKI